MVSVWILLAPLLVQKRILHIYFLCVAPWVRHSYTGLLSDVNLLWSAQLLIAEQDGYHLIEGLQEPGVSLAFTTPCFSNYEKYNRGKMTEVFIDSTFGTNKHGYELYCVLAEYDLVSLQGLYRFSSF
ncbi:hypothetical protein V1520DRAFT_310721 [Lipomyces starkeyi]|uniref:Uncharacterized protein n=1 Tax=Lipomyces starkeyi NRRL Y-11557 TaxID=675824 RepID=A0A1E3PXC7_LIPST|nr:hypothetical protein LIPSTDRAFT_186923 [Lipomyces starkeyi NRRL Y-11557]